MRNSPPARTSLTMSSKPARMTERSNPAHSALPFPAMHTLVACAPAVSSAACSASITLMLKALALPSSRRTIATPSSTVVVTASLMAYLLLGTGELHHRSDEHGEAHDPDDRQFQSDGEAVAAPRDAWIQGVGQAGRDGDVVEHRPAHGVDGVAHRVDLGEEGQPAGEAVEGEHGARQEEHRQHDEV